MNKKAMFFSLSVVLFLLLLLIIFNAQSKIKEDEVKSYAGRAQLIVMDNFVKDFDQYYVQQILETAAKHAFVELSASTPNFNRNNLENIMEDGMDPEKITKKNFEQALGTLAFTIPDSDREFSYEITSVSQPTFNTIKMDFEVDYEFTVFDTTWSKVDKPVTVEFPVWGITHPSYSPGGIIDDSWVEDVNGCIPNCLLSDLMAGGHFDCPLGVNNIIPSYLVDSCLT